MYSVLRHIGAYSILTSLWVFTVCKYVHYVRNNRSYNDQHSGISAYEEIGAHFISCSLRYYIVLTLAMMFCKRLFCKFNQIRMTCKRDLHKAYILWSTHTSLDTSYAFLCIVGQPINVDQAHNNSNLNASSPQLAQHPLLDGLRVLTPLFSQAFQFPGTGNDSYFSPPLQH